VDVVRATLCAGGLAAMTFGLIEQPARGWGDPSVIRKPANSAAPSVMVPSNRPEHAPDASPSGPGADRLTALVGRKVRDDHGQRRGGEQRTGHALKGSSDHQHLDRRRQRAEE